MAASLEKRKRSREEEMVKESMPLTKRINRLHINYEDIQWNDNSSSSSSCSTMAPPAIDNNHVNGVISITEGSVSTATAEMTNTGSNAEQSAQQQYNPDLNQDQNPFYYSKNKFLYELHMERLRRHESH